MHRILLAICLFFFTNSISFAQGVDYKIFRSVCEELLSREKYYLAREKYKNAIDNDIVPVIDPKTGDTRIIYKDSSSAETIEFSRAYTYDEQWKILSIDSATRYPLADTVCIIDSIGFFREPLQYDDGIAFRVAHCMQKEYCCYQGDGCYLVLKNVYVQDNDLVLNFHISNTQLFFKCTFSLNSESITLSKSSIYAPGALLFE